MKTKYYSIPGTILFYVTLEENFEIREIFHIHSTFPCYTIQNRGCANGNITDR